MKFVIVLLASVLAVTMASQPHPCQCWPDWQPENDAQGWHCVPKSEKSFSCNVDPPPTCVCKDKGKDVSLPSGEINCLGQITKFDKDECEKTAEWESWYQKYPQYRAQH
ncbi:uncharacterized protein LOC115877770 [Sitophilus oryzae]|uniref:Uncharacterized protein LOC115877770 n=1 Tax=Sitophilus oryzae TaxID=7048 RepID=A0A6J2XGU5_SITOR|nr:uncharacterized protein LOC115877770 [Sitophilus oryzae]